MLFEQRVTCGGVQIEIRNLKDGDAAAAILCLRKTAGETDYLLREPAECGMTIAQEKEYTGRMNAALREAFLGAFIGSELIGMANLSRVSPRTRTQHRAAIGISLAKSHWGKGIGSAMMRALILLAKEAGYEQMELEVVDSNARAIALYEKFGFETVGRMPQAIRYADGRYADLLLMLLRL